jgi:prepilin-type processing-associated H-X9-DG protein
MSERKPEPSDKAIYVTPVPSTLRGGRIDRIAPNRVYVDRTFGGHRYHCDSCRPSLASLIEGQNQAEAITCVNNLKQLSLCWIMYANDHDDRLVPNWLATTQAWIGGAVHQLPGATNLNDIKNAKLFPYNQSVDIYRCPAARDLPNSLRSDSRMRGRRLVRNFSMQGRMGGGDASDVRFAPDTTWVLGAKYPQYKKLSQIASPPPTQALVFIDESKETVDDGYFAVKAPDSAERDIWQNSPSVRHNRAGVLSFADGHAENWRWRFLTVDQGLDAPARRGGVDSTPDLRRLQDVVARP